MYLPLEQQSESTQNVAKTLWATSKSLVERWIYVLSPGSKQTRKVFTYINIYKRIDVNKKHNSK